MWGQHLRDFLYSTRSLLPVAGHAGKRQVEIVEAHGFFVAQLVAAIGKGFSGSN